MLSPTEFECLKSEFEDRLYCWSSEEADREIATGFPVLRRMCNPTAERLLRSVDGWPIEKQRQLLAAHRKRNNAARRAGHTMTALDEGLIEEAYAKQSLLRFNSHALKRAPAAPVRRAIAKALRPRLKELLGPPIDGMKSRWKFRTLVRGWKLNSVVDWGGSIHVVSYRQRISGGTPMEETGVGLGVVSWPACIGLPSLDSWPEVSLDAAQQVAASITELCARMLDVAPQLLPCDWPEP